MKVWLLGLGLALLCTVHASLDDPEAPEKVQGSWHAVALSSDCKYMLKHKHHMKVMQVDVKKLEDGSVNLVSNIHTRRGCKKLDMTFTRNEDGTFTHICKLGKQTVHKLDTDYETYSIVEATFTKDSKTCRVVTLYVRDVDSQPIGLLEKFREHSLELGFTSDQIIFLPKANRDCSESQDENAVSPSEEQGATQ